MKRKLTLLLQELRRMKNDGVKTLPVSDEAMARLRALRQKAGLASPARPSDAAREQKAPAVAAKKVPRADDQAAAAAREMLATFNTTAPAKPGSAPSRSAPPSSSSSKLPPPPKVVLPEGDKQTQWEALREQVLGCPVCNGQVKPGKKVVFGVGNLDADIFFVGEAPGAEEEVQGEPFVGKAGETLTRMIRAMGLERRDVYIGNIMNWRPPPPGRTGNRPPTAEEMAFCLPYLLAQIEIVRPRVLVALGNTAVSGLFGHDPARRMKDVRGRWHEFNRIPVMITFHPSYLLRNESRAVKRQVWEDLLQVMEKADLPISDKQRRYFLPKES